MCGVPLRGRVPVGRASATSRPPATCRGQAEAFAADVVVGEGRRRLVVEAEQPHRPLGHGVGLGVERERPRLVALAVDAAEARLLEHGGVDVVAVVDVTAVGQHPLHELPEHERVFVVVGRVVVRRLAAVLGPEGLDEELAPRVAGVVGVEVVVGEVVPVEGAPGDVDGGRREVGADDRRLQARRGVGLHQRGGVAPPHDPKHDVGVHLADLADRPLVVRGALARRGDERGAHDLGAHARRLLAQAVDHAGGERPEVVAEERPPLGVGHLLGQVLGDAGEGVVGRDGPQPPGEGHALEHR